MQGKLYEEFHQILERGRDAFEYGETHFEELIHREVVHTLYGARTYGPGAAFPSRQLIKDSMRVLRSKNRRRSDYTEYFFDTNWDLLYSRHYVEGRLDCTVLHYWIDGINYSRFFSQDSSEFYKYEICSVKYNGRIPTCCTLSSRTRVYVEYYSDHPNDETHMLKDFTWYNYYPTREFSREGIPLTKDAPFGASNSPVDCGCGTIKLFLGEDRQQLAEAANCWLIV